VKVYDNTVLSRLDNPKEGAIIIVMQRLHEDDLVGHVTAREDHDWTILSIPAIAIEDAAYRTGNGAHDVYERREGELLDPKRMDQPQYDEIRDQLGSLRTSSSLKGLAVG
jgi:hypothetical protein